jgi:hypothetical protein
MTNLYSALEFLRGVQFTGNHCIFTSLAVRDFLRRIGIKADVKSVALIINASQEGLPLHTVGIGMNKLWNEPYEGDKWDGHLIVTVPGFIIDPTFHAVRRSAWGWTPNIMVAKRGSTPRFNSDIHPDLPVIAAVNEESPEHSYRFQAVWFSYSRNSGWRNTPDGRDPIRRQDIINEMMNAWKESVK